MKRWAYMLGDTAEMVAPSWRMDLKLCSNLFEMLYSCSNEQRLLRPSSIFFVVAVQCSITRTINSSRCHVARLRDVPQQVTCSAPQQDMAVQDVVAATERKWGCWTLCR